MFVLTCLEPLVDGDCQNPVWVSQGVTIAEFLDVFPYILSFLLFCWGFGQLVRLILNR